VPFIEIPDPHIGHAYLATLPSPRLLATHLPLSSLLPHEMYYSDGGCRIVYLCRDPKDALVSRWHFENKTGEREGFSMELEKAFAMFCEGVSENGPFWDHCLEYWKESLARPDKVFFLKYEEIKSDPVQAVRKLAGFLGASFSEDEESLWCAPGGGAAMQL
jgi:estrone sulfotransferase